MAKKMGGGRTAAPATPASALTAAKVLVGTVVLGATAVPYG